MTKEEAAKIRESANGNELMSKSEWRQKVDETLTLFYRKLKLESNAEFLDLLWQGKPTRFLKRLRKQVRRDLAKTTSEYQGPRLIYGVIPEPKPERLPSSQDSFITWLTTTASCERKRQTP